MVVAPVPSGTLRLLGAEVLEDHWPAVVVARAGRRQGDSHSQCPVPVLPGVCVHVVPTQAMTPKNAAVVATNRSASSSHGKWPASG
jgi:hypothetical protein